MSYPSDLTDDQWNLLEPVFNAPGKRDRRHADDLRTVVDAMLSIAQTGCQWRYLSESFGPWTRVWSQFRRWSRNGTLARALTVLDTAARDQRRRPDQVRVLPSARCEDDTVSVDGGAVPPLPSSIWVVAWASLAGQAMLLARQGVRLDDEVSLVLSVVLGALLVGYVSAGVVRARTVRLAFAWVVLVLSLIAELVGLVSVDDLGQAALVALSLATTALALAGLARFRRTEWYTWQRTKPSVHEGAPIGQLVAMGVLVGVLGGLIGPVDDGLDVRISVADR